MARTVSGRKAVRRKASSRKAAPKAKAKGKAKAAVKKKASAVPARKGALRKAAAKAQTAMKTAAPKRAGGLKKSATRAPVKKAVSRTAVARRQTSRRTRAVVPAPRKVATRRLKTAGPTQEFSVSHLNETDFKKHGLRPYALYRDLGIEAATSGLCQAHVIRLLSPPTDEVRKSHVHETELQLIYVLKGWVKNEFDGHGEQMMSAGSCWLQPPGIKHTVLDYSPDVELLEIIVPADFKTADVS